MRLTVVGKEIVDYVNKKTGAPTKGVRIFYTCAPDSNGVEGLCAGEVYFSSKYSGYAQALPLAVGDEVDAYYNQRGYLDTLVPIPAAPADKK